MNYDQIHIANRGRILQEHKDFLQRKAFVEFGVYHGTSMLMWHNLYEQHGIDRNFIGFDSFMGIPEEHEDKNNLKIWGKGCFSTDGSINPALIRDDIRLVKGFFDESLDASAAKLLGDVKIGLVHVDCDTYTSAKTIWEWLIGYDLLARGALIVYDDWGGYLPARCDEYDIGEAKAHREIEAKHGIDFTDLGKYVVDPAFYEVKVYRYE